MITRRSLRKFLRCSETALDVALRQAGLPLNPHYRYSAAQARAVLAQVYSKVGAGVLDRKLGLEDPLRPDRPPLPNEKCPR